jgi:hypothetical protein
MDKDDATVRRLAKTKRVLNGHFTVKFLDYYGYEETTTLGRWTAMHACVREDRPEMLQILIDNKAKMEIKDVDGETPLFVAATSNRPNIVELLIKGGANPNAVAKDGWSCLMAPARDGYYEVTKQLLEGGAAVHAGRDVFGRSALDLVQHFRSDGGMNTSGRRVDGYMYMYTFPNFLSPGM